jgi:hypothetical protein
MHKLYRAIKWPKNVGYFRNFNITAKSKQSPIGRKFAQSGHPGQQFQLMRNNALSDIQKTSQLQLCTYIHMYNIRNVKGATDFKFHYVGVSVLQSCQNLVGGTRKINQTT